MKFEEYKELTQGQKRRKENGLQNIGYLLHRNFSVFISYFMVRFLPFVTPNMISMAMLALALYGSWLIYVGDVGIKLVGVVVIYLSFLLDKVDGEVARYKKMESLRGVYLDELYHAFAPFAFLVGFFFSTAYNVGTAPVLLLMLGIFLTLFRRYERKWFIIIAYKKRGLLQAGTALSPLKNHFISLLVNNWLIKITSVVERFDVVLLTAFLVLLIQKYMGLDWILYFLSVYVILSALYSIRWIIANYFGELDKRVTGLAQTQTNITNSK